MLEAVSALRNSVAPENLAGSTGFGPFDHGSCEAKFLVGTEISRAPFQTRDHFVWVRTPGVLTGHVLPVGVGRSGKTLARQ